MTIHMQGYQDGLHDNYNNIYNRFKKKEFNNYAQYVKGFVKAMIEVVDKEFKAEEHWQEFAE